MKIKLTFTFLFVLCTIGLLMRTTRAEDVSLGVQIQAETVYVACCEYGRYIDTEIKITFLSGPGSLKSASLDLSTDLHNGVYFDLQHENGRFVSGVGVTAQDIRVDFASPTLLNIQFSEGSFTAGDSLLLAVNIEQDDRGPGDTFTADLFNGGSGSVRLAEVPPDPRSHQTAVGIVAFSFGATVAAEARGSTTPPQAPFPNTVSNGDFTMRPSGNCAGEPSSCPTGDGSNDLTTWTFNFNNDVGLSDFIDNFKKAGQLSSVKLILQLTPKPGGFSTDDVRIQGLPVIELANAVPNFENIRIGVLTTIEIELLNFYTSNKLK